MNKLLLYTLFFGTMLLLPLINYGNNEPKKKPNIIFILTDDLGYGDLGVLYQNQRKAERKPYHSTPNLDKMAAEGMTLTRHYVPAPVCAPSRATLLLGLHQGHATIRNNQFDKALPPNYNLATVLKEAGYATALIGKYGLQGLEGDSPETWEAYPSKRGFDYFFGYVRHRDGHNHYPAHDVADRGPMEFYDGDQEISKKLKGSYTTDLFTARAKKYIQDHKKEKADQPFFMYLAFDTPHAGLEVPSMAYPTGGGLKGGLQYIGEDGNYVNTSQGEVNQFIHPDYRKEDWPEVQQRFASMVRRIDSSVGDLIQLLKDLDIDEDTFIVFTSDNGPHLESYGYGDYAPTFFESYANMDGTKRDTWEGGIRVPALVRWPGKIQAGTKNDTPSGFHDWMPTFAALSGVPAPANTDGRSLWPLLSGEEEKFDGKVYIEYQVNNNTSDYESFLEERRGQKRGEMQVLYLDGYKGIRYNIASHQDDFQIYDTKKDPGETHNLAGTNNEFVRLQQEMKNSVLRWRRYNESAQRPYDKEPVPALALEKELETGVKILKYKMNSPWVPFIDTSVQLPEAVEIMEDFKIKKEYSPYNLFVFKGYLKVDAPGTYHIIYQTNGHMVMHIHEALVIDEGNPAVAQGNGSFEIILEKGYHPLKLVYKVKENTTPELNLTWDGQGNENAALNLYHDE